MSKILEFLLEKYGGALVAKALTALCGVLVTHGMMKQSDSMPWVETTVGMITGGISFAITHYRDKAKQDAIAVAKATPVTPEAIAALTSDQAGRVLAGGGVGMGATDIPRRGSQGPVASDGTRLFVFLVGLLMASSVLAQEAATNTAPPTTTATGYTNAAPSAISHTANALTQLAVNNPNVIISTPANAASSLLEYIASHGQSGQGYAWGRVKNGGKTSWEGGVLLTEGVNITKDRQFNFAEFHIDADAGQFLQGGNTRIQLGISPVLTVFSTPQLQDAKTSWGLLNWLPVNISKVQVAPYAGMDVDKLVARQISRKAAAFGIEFKWDF